MARVIFYIFVVLYGSLVQGAKPEVLRVYLDADRTGHLESALSIEHGVKVAFAQVNNQLSDIPVEFVTTDHRGNVLRSKKNMERFIKDANGLVYIGGLHSPPFIRYREYINQSKMLTLVPWAAGTPITRYPSAEDNYVFRLSVDDSKVGNILVNYALKQKCQQPHLILENTGWGKSNYRAMMSALPENLTDRVQTSWFNWGIKDVDARILIREAQSSGGDCVLLVSNSREGKLIVESVAQMDIDMPIYSHWGITGGRFAQDVPYDSRNKAKLRFIQSCFNFYSSDSNSFNQAVFKDAQTLFPAHFEDTNIQAPAGFVHGYDLAKVFIEAARTVELSQDAQSNRTAMKQALESLKTPVQGLIKEYNSPFSPFDEDNFDAHEALNSNDFCMALYDENNAVKLLPKSI
ncbi:ABC transporter substrate-binding protein [Vibrio ostreicida]|uniref:ABC transporter substrate-binding protein n=1 Tax=Vibrio ostreicida TaxID=526588 RepID=A0ABT8BUT3_9VIBR|nr:ABC transporter substrate-binding protein [Vibrio ostreicida]MDN3610146.1 ABC transporter substrate-binding protein [Vibrio ostreicida]NPD07830.1 ABC transporter substrate-binding protein [Vibrio ostreicida]